MAHHGVKLMQGLDSGLQILKGQAHLVSKCFDVLILMGEELMQGRIEETDGNRASGHRFINALKVAALHRQQLLKCSTALYLGLGDDHLAHCRDTVALKEHVLGSG
ncbi:hypothetical protein SDC9_152676 [bioreactor metagenome]|uniref:Uncharacterized protein n=1 Tax=bioreactor metagenome TaxID=1076179 RepID=A0A645EVH2_9ZZZZ